MKTSIARRTTASLALALMLASAPAPAPAADRAPLAERVAATLRQIQGPGTRFGLMVTTLDGREVVALSPDDRFVPASNTKVYTTAAVFANIAELTRPDTVGGAAVRLDGGDVVLEGHGDARLSSKPDCTVDCLATLADAVAARTRSVDDVIGDDSDYPDERWSPGMGWNNIQSRYGTGISALTIDDNELAITVRPGKGGRAAAIEALPYYTIDNQVTTVAGGKTALRLYRMPNSRQLRIGGTIAAEATPSELAVGIDDPAEFAAWRLKALLVERGVKVRGRVDVRHRPLAPADDPEVRAGAPAASAPSATSLLLKLVPPPLIEDLTHTNKVSQNLHAELFLRRVARLRGSGSIADGQAAVEAMLESAGVPRWAYDFSDGSGMSTYNRVTPRASVTLMRWIAAQPWGAAFRSTLPVGGVDGTLAKRFKGTPLEGKVFAKTGTLNQANALAGYMTAASGQMLVIAVYAGDMPGDASATAAMDAALNLIAAEN